MLAKLKADGRVRSTWSWTCKDGNKGKSKRKTTNLSVESNSWTTSSAEIEIARLKCISNHSTASAEKTYKWSLRRKDLHGQGRVCIISYHEQTKAEWFAKLLNQAVLRRPPWCCGLSWTFCEIHTCAWATDKADKDDKDSGCQDTAGILSWPALSSGKILTLLIT